LDVAVSKEKIWTIHEAAALIREKKLSPVELLDECLANIDRYEPRVRAWVFVAREQAREQAARAHTEIQQGKWRGPLHGIPIGIKDIFDVFDWPTAAGSKLWANSVARRDATVVARLREAGAVFLGKTVTTQYASFDPPVTRNPWKLDRTPGGSSSGSAAGIACGMCLGALGSQTGGSITRPASYCGVYGCKPTWGTVSVDGVVPLAPSLDHVGPIAGCVRDLALLLQTIASFDSKDDSMRVALFPDLAATLDEECSAPRIGRVGGLFTDLAQPPIRLMMDQVTEKLRSKGAEVKGMALPGGFADVRARHRTIMAVESAAFHEQRLRRHPEDYEPKVKGLLEEGIACPASEYARCKEHQKQLQEDMSSFLTHADVLLAPATTGPAPDAGSTGDPAFQSPWSYTGLPTICLPAGRDPEGLPLCIQLVGQPCFEERLFVAALWCEQALGRERALPTI
jgi:aspartyl-tRNA(Asn)/glutamyl-tRNA(Gln) amidotransferase subunit A